MLLSADAAATTRLTELERSIFDESTLGVVERDLANRVYYANKAALDMMGAQSYENLDLVATFADEKARRIFEEQTVERRKRLVGNYRVELTRLDDPHRKIDVEITGVPLLDARGEVVRALGFYRSLERQSLIEEIRNLTLTHGESGGQIARSPGDRRGMLRMVADKVRTALPFDLLLVSRIHTKDNESDVYFSHPVFEQKVPTVWVRLNEAQMSYMVDRAGGITDFEEVMSAPPWNDLEDHPMIRQMRAMKLKSSMWRWARRPGQSDEQPMATISLLSTRPDAYDDAAQKLFQELPLDEAVLQALDDEQRLRMARKLQLFKDLNRCANVVQACERLAGALVEMFEDWSHVSLFRVEKGLDLIRMVASMREVAGSCTADASRLWADYTQPITEGILGEVVDSRQPVNAGDVSKVKHYVQGPFPYPVVSELVVPIVFEDEQRVRFLINVDDPRRNAFSRQDEAQLMEIAREVAGAMQRISQVAFLSECFDNASEPIIATDAKLHIRKANPAAAQLFGVARPGDLSEKWIGDYFENTAPFKALAAGRSEASENLGELAVKRRLKDEPAPLAFVTRKDFPDSLGGHVFIARDLSSIRSAAQLEFLEHTAYAVAVETQAPLDLASAFLERLIDRSELPDPRELQKVLRQLGRVKHAFDRLSMYSPQARTSARNVTTVNLSGELHALCATLTCDDRSKIDIEDEGHESVEVEADHTQVLIVFETLLAALLRAAPENAKVRIALALEDKGAVVRLRGKLPPAEQAPSHSTALESAQADLRRADPLLQTLMSEQGGGTLVVNAQADGDTEFVLCFPHRRSRA